MAENVDRFKKLLSTIDRPGIDNLLLWLKKSDAYSCPASTKYHSACEGGLIDHSLAVYDQLLTINSAWKLALEPDTIKIVAPLHDLAKVNFYTVSMRNVKNDETGQWEKKPFYQIDDQLPYGHGEKSVFLISKFIDLSNEEAMAIRWHMGFSTTESYADKQALSAAMEKYPLILALQMADQAATFWDKK